MKFQLYDFVYNFRTQRENALTVRVRIEGGVVGAGEEIFKNVN